MSKNKHTAEIKAAAKTVSLATGVPESLLYAAVTVLAEKESGFNPKAVGKTPLADGTRAQGMFQYIPTSAKQRGIDPFNVTQAATAAATDAATAFKRGGVAEIAASHFAGSGGSGRGPKTREYVRDFLGKMTDMGASAYKFAPDRTPRRGRQNAATPADDNPFSGAAAPDAAMAEAPEDNPFAVAEAAPEPVLPEGMQEAMTAAAAPTPAEADPMSQYEAKAPAAPRLAQLDTNPFGGHDVKRDPTTLKWFESMIENADG